MLVYDWATAADPERVVEDVERMDLDFFEWHDGDMLEEWNTMDDGWEWNYYRDLVTNKTDLVNKFEDIVSYEVDELHPHPDEYEQFLGCMKVNVFGPRAVGFNREKGDSVSDMFFASNAAEDTVGKVPWYEHYWRDVWFGQRNSFFSWLDTDGKEGFNPHYHPH